MIKKLSILKAIALAGVFSLLVGSSSMASPYTVAKGDCLWKIAREKLGDGRRYMEIFEANRDKITDPNKIQIGQVLEIPEGQPAPAPVPAPTPAPVPDLPVITTTISKDENFGSAVLDISPDKFKEAGFHLGDSCDISFESGLQLYDVPFYDGYYVRFGEPVIVAYPGLDTVDITYNDVSIWEEENLFQGEKITIQMNTPEKYKDFWELMKQEYSFERSDYSSDEEFCNFRALSGGSLKEDFFYRGASPVDNSRGRAAYTDKLLAEYGIQAVLDLADSEENIEKYQASDDYASPYADALYKDGKIYLADMSSAFSTDVYKQKLVGGLKYIMNLPGPLYIHCTEGKDRTGFVCMLLEALAGASYEEMKADYMLTYKNYYGVDLETNEEKYNAIADLYFDGFMCYLHDTEDTSIFKNVDFSKDAEEYLLEGGMTIEEVSALREYLTGSSEPGDGEDIKLKITVPSEANGPIAPGRSFYVRGDIISNEPIPEDARVRVSVYSDDTELRYAEANRKDNHTIDRFNPAFFYYSEDADPNREALLKVPVPMLIVEDENHPEKSIKNANIKCYYSDKNFVGFIPYATDEAHGLLFDDGIGYTDKDGIPYDGLPSGNYTAVAVLSDSKGNELARTAKDFQIAPAKNSILCRFHPDEHYKNMMDFAKANDLSMNIDGIPGYYKDSSGSKGGLRQMFIGGDVAVYSTSKVHMFIYLADAASSSLTFEVPYLEKYRNIDDPEVFTAYCYDIGEPVLRGGEKELKGQIVQIDDGDKLRLCRADIAKAPKEGFLDLKDYKILETDTDFSDGVALASFEDGTLCISGVVVPHQLRDEEILFDLPNNNTSLLNYTESIVYEISDGKDTREYVKKVSLERLLDDKEHSRYPSMLEFYHTFDSKDFSAGTSYSVKLYGIDKNGKRVPGTEESFTMVF